MSEPALFDLTPPDLREGSDDHRHVLLPNMSYACGGNILTKRGRSSCGTWNWDEITCPECREPGREYLSAVVQWMQGHGPHPDDAAVAEALS